MGKVDTNWAANHGQRNRYRKVSLAHNIYVQTITEFLNNYRMPRCDILSGNLHDSSLLKNCRPENNGSVLKIHTEYNMHFYESCSHKYNLQNR